MERADMDTGVERTTTLVEPTLVDRSAALDLVRCRSWRGLLRLKTDLDARLLFKPFWHVPVTLGSSDANQQAAQESRIIVDGITGVGRFLANAEDRPPPQFSCLDPGEALSPSVNSEAAQHSTNKILFQLRAKDGREVLIQEAPRLIYRPVWVVSTSKGPPGYVIDAYTRYVTRLTASTRSVAQMEGEPDNK